MCRPVDIFRSHMTPSWWRYKLLGRSVIWTSPKSCTYPTLVPIDPQFYFIKIVTVQRYSAPLLLTIAYFLLLLKRNVVCILIFSKRVSDLKFKLLSFLKKLYNMSSTTYIHDPLPVTPWCHSMTQTWANKHWEYLGMKL